MREVRQRRVSDRKPKPRAKGAALRGVKRWERMRVGRRRWHAVGGGGRWVGARRRGKRARKRFFMAALKQDVWGARMLPLWDTQPHRRAPVATGFVIAACFVVFGYEVCLSVNGEAGFAAWVAAHALVPSRLVADWADPVQWQTVGTSMFLHGGVAHLLGNCWFLWVFGNNVEDRLGFAGFALFYLVSGVAAALTQVAVDPGSNVPMVGASGAISGVLGAYLVFFPRAWVISLVPWVVPILPIPAVIFLPLWFFIQAYAGVGALFSETGGAGGIAWWAHAGGFAAGVGLALLLPRRSSR